LNNGNQNSSASGGHGGFEDEDDDHSLEDDGILNVQRDNNFCKTILEFVVTGAKEEQPSDSILLEIKGLKFAQNKVRKP
jgi:hypothetical protein